MSETVEALVREHEAAVARYAAAARAVAAWDRGPEGKWSPAEITEHLCLAYEAGLREVREGVGMAPRVRGWRLLVVRWLYLRPLLRRNLFPSGARAPRETRPSALPESRDAAIERLTALAVESQRVLLGGSASLRHPYFGRITGAEAMHIQTRHLDHHRAQVEALARTVPLTTSN